MSTVYKALHGLFTVDHILLLGRLRAVSGKNAMIYGMYLHVGGSGPMIAVKVANGWDSLGIGFTHLLK